MSCVLLPVTDDKNFSIDQYTQCDGVPKFVRTAISKFNLSNPTFNEFARVWIERCGTIICAVDENNNNNIVAACVIDETLTVIGEKQYIPITGFAVKNQRTGMGTAFFQHLVKLHKEMPGLVGFVLMAEKQVVPFWTKLGFQHDARAPENAQAIPMCFEFKK